MTLMSAFSSQLGQATRTRHAALFIAALFALTSLAACHSDTLEPIAPLPRGQGLKVAELPEVPLSVVDAPITYALEPAVDALEKAVPRSFGDIEKRITIPSNTRQQIAFAAKRTPFTVSFDGKTLTVGTVVTYSGRGWYNPMIGPTISASCGTDTLPPRLSVVIKTEVNIARDWNLRPKTRLASVAPVSTDARDECRVTAFSIDVTDRVITAIKPFLGDRLSGVDRKIAAFDVRTRLERWYNLLNKNIHVTDSLWLVLAPQGVRLGSLALEDSALVANVRLYARPVMVSGPKPPQAVSKLPPFDRTLLPVGDSAHLRLEGLLDYDDASARINKEIAGRKFRRFGQSVTIDKVRMYALGDGRIVLDVGMHGGVNGQVYLVGTPVIDSVSHKLTVPDLDFDVATADVLVAGLAWLKKGDVVNTLREKAQLPLDDLLDESRARVEKALNRELTDGVYLSGRVTTGRLIDVSAAPHWLVVRADARGSLALHVDREIKVKKR